MQRLLTGGELLIHPLQPADHSHFSKLSLGSGRMLLPCRSILAAAEEPCKAPMTMSGERAHLQLLREPERHAIVRVRLRDLVALCGHGAEKPKRVRLVSALHVCARELER